MDKGAVRLCDGRLELAEETFCKILSDCRGERDMEFDEIGENHDIPPDSEEEGDLTGLTTIWSRRRPVHPPRYMEDLDFPNNKCTYLKSAWDVWAQFRQILLP